MCWAFLGHDKVTISNAVIIIYITNLKVLKYDATIHSKSLRTCGMGKASHGEVFFLKHPLPLYFIAASLFFDASLLIDGVQRLRHQTIQPRRRAFSQEEGYLLQLLVRYQSWDEIHVTGPAERSLFSSCLRKTQRLTLAAGITPYRGFIRHLFTADTPSAAT